MDVYVVTWGDFDHDGLGFDPTRRGWVNFERGWVQSGGQTLPVAKRFDASGSVPSFPRVFDENDDLVLTSFFRGEWVKNLVDYAAQECNVDRGVLVEALPVDVASRWLARC